MGDDERVGWVMRGRVIYDGGLFYSVNTGR